MVFAKIKWDCEKDILNVSLKEVKDAKIEKVASNVFITRNSKGEILHIKILDIMQDM
ncbi:MAG: hypothetical protein K0B02_04690 [DPANN group archaeon]|nr:hypothetical protein [DPANN group archaeon]